MALANLLEKLGPKATDTQRKAALTIVVKGIEIYRECAPRDRRLTGTVQKSRRALGKLKNGKTGTGQLPFNSFIRLGGVLYGAASDGLYKIEDVPVRSDESYGDIEDAIAAPLRTYAAMQQIAAGFKHIDVSIPFNGHSGIAENCEARTFGDVLLDEIANPQDWQAELAGFAYLSLAKGLGVQVRSTQPVQPPKRTGANYWQLLKLALQQAGVQLPAEKPHSNPVRLERLMGAGKKVAEGMLAPMVTYVDGRAYSDFEMMFPGE
jgi:hypothetical protein